ncbi:MAG: AAA family ATPase [Candidatus Krumholzibacteriia bacterium]
MELSIPSFCLIVLIGPAGSGKTTFARRHFKPTEILSSDSCREWVSDDENNQAATADAFEVLHLVTTKRLARRRLTVIDATNVQKKARRPLLELAREHRCPCVGVVFDLPGEVCLEQNLERPDRSVAPDVVRKQIGQLRDSLAALPERDIPSPTMERDALSALREEGLQEVYVFRCLRELDGATVERRPRAPSV